MKNSFYVYVYFRPNGIPCYVGKGHRNRWKQHLLHAGNLHLQNIIIKAGGEVPVVIVRSGLTEEQSLETERALILAIGRECNDGPLVNLTDGGDGVTGLRHTDETKRKTSEAACKMWQSEDNRKRIIKAQNIGLATAEYRALRKEISVKIWTPELKSEMSKKKKKQYAQDERLCQKISSATKAALATEEARQKISTAQKRRFENPNEIARLRSYKLGKIQSQETKDKISAANRGQKRTAESRAKMSAWQIGRKMSDEARIRMSVSAKARWARSSANTTTG